MSDYSCNLVLNAPPHQVFSALTTQQGFQGWWTDNCEVDAQPGELATFRFGKTRNIFRFEQLEPDREVLMTCIEQYHHLPGILNKTDEWVDTQIRFQLAAQANDATELTFTHHGLIPSLECYTICEGGWDHFIKSSLKNFVERDKGEPYNEQYPYSE